MAKHCEVILYPEDAWENSKIIEVMQSKQSIKQFAFILHDKDVDENENPKKSHFHVYINFGSTNVQFKSVAQWFNVAENAVQRIESNKASLLQYYLHKNYPDKHQYSLDQIISNFDVKRYIDEKNQKSKLSDIITACAEGTITPYNYQDFVDPVTYAKYEVQLKRAWAYADHHYATANNGQRNCGIIWVYGDSGMGKSTLCQLFAEEKKLAAYRSATGKDPFSDYAGQPVIVLDDLRANEPFTFPELLKAIDPNYNCPVQSRYRNKVLRASHIFVTSVFSPTNFTSQFDLRGNDSGVQLYRRISEVWHVQQHTIEVSKYDMGLGKFVLLTTPKNPVPDYLTRIAISVPPINGADILGKLADKYQIQNTFF